MSGNHIPLSVWTVRWQDGSIEVVAASHYAAKKQAYRKLGIPTVGTLEVTYKCAYVRSSNAS